MPSILARVSAPTPGARLVRNTVTNGIGAVLVSLIGLALTPFMIHHLGLAAFGVWALALTFSFGGYAALADLGIEGATVRYVAESVTDGNIQGLNRTVSTSLAVFCSLGVILAAAAAALSGPVVDLFGISAHLQGEARICFALVAGQLALELPARAFVAVLEGSQLYFVYQAVELGRSLLQAALYVAVLLEGWGLTGLAGALALSSGSALLAYWALAHRAVPGLHVSPFGARRTELRRLVRFGGGVFTLKLVSTVYGQMDKAIVGIALGARQVGLYEIANRINVAAANVASISVSAVVPAAASLRRDAALLRDMFLRGSAYATAFSLPFAVAAFIFARPLLLSWIGPSAAPAVGAARLFVLYEAIQIPQAVASTMMYGLGHFRMLIIVNGTATALNLGLSIALVGPLGFSGVIVGTLIANGLALPVLLAYYLRVFDCRLLTWFHKLVVPNLPGLVIQVTVSLGLYYTVGQHTRSLPLAALLFAASVAVSFAGFVLLGVRGQDRKLVAEAIRRAAGRPSREVPV
jgi:O-antigen/teichoic acid export membrane protein